MSDKDQFTFDDDDGFPETNLGDQENSPISDLPADEDSSEADLSTSFFDDEHEVETQIQEEPELIVQKGGSVLRLALLVLLLVVIGGAGVYYFMDLGGTTPSAPAVQVPAQKAKKSVALPPQPAKAPAKTAVAPTKAKQEAKPVTVAVPPPPAEPAAKAADKTADKSADKMAQAKQPEVAEKPKPVKKTETQLVSPAPKPEPAMEKMAVVAPPVTKPASSSKQVAGGVYALDAGSYLLESNRKALVIKIKKLGYEPFITPVDATLDMTRLRLGTFSKDEVQEALDFARTIEPGSYSAPAGEQYVIYAGTFLNSRVADKLTQRFLAEGIRVYPEPVQVVRTLSRVRFGSFATKADAVAAASEVGKVGLKAKVVKSK